jgi:hypothetical protein
MKNNGYYSWIHSLNAAGVQAQNNANKMLMEAKASKITDPSKKMELGKKLAPQPKAMETINPEDGLPVKPTADIRDISAALSGLGKTTPGTIALGKNTDVGAYVDIRRTKHREALATLAQARGPVSLKPTGNANEVEADGQDGVMADPESFTIPSASHIPDEPVSRVHPEPYYSSPEEAHAAVKGLNQYYNQPDEDEDEHLSFPTANWSQFKESVNYKIRRILGL